MKTLDARIRRVDEDRWLSSRYAPGPAARRALIALYALNYELVRIPRAIREPGLGAIRLQWWREALQQLEAGQAPRRHDVVLALKSSIESGFYEAGALQRLVEGHEMAFESGRRDEEPEPVLAAIAANALAGAHGWGEPIRELAQTYAGLRRGEPLSYGPIVKGVPTAIRPALAHFRLRWSYGAQREPGVMARRLVILRAMLTGTL